MGASGKIGHRAARGAFFVPACQSGASGGIQIFSGVGQPDQRAFGNGLKIVDLDVAGRFGIAAPLGISFYTLQAAGYLLDVYRGRCAPEKNWARYAAFVSFFPNILSGPIERGRHFLEQLDGVLKASRRQLYATTGLRRGLFPCFWDIL